MDERDWRELRNIVRKNCQCPRRFGFYVGEPCAACRLLVDEIAVRLLDDGRRQRDVLRRKEGIG